MARKAKTLSATTARRNGASSLRPSLELMARSDFALQNEINLALWSLVTNSAPADLRLVRMLRAILVPGWLEHINLQKKVLFPIIMRNQGSDAVEDLLARLREDHVRLTRFHDRLALDFGRVISGTLKDLAGYRDRLLTLLEVRRHHFKAEAPLMRLLPAVLATADERTIERWTRERPSPPFPISILRSPRLH
jgi:hypothetical protein